MAKKRISSNLSDLLSKDALELLTSNGVQLVQTIGIEAIRDVVLDILSGKNLRDSTEFITRRRISFLNLTLFEMLIDNADKSTIYELIDRSVEILQQKRIPKTERWLAQWILGFKFVSSPEVESLKKIFWFSSRGERRESDATLIYGAGKGVRFDIGLRKWQKY